MVPYERFDAWKMTHQLALQVYQVTESWPVSERLWPDDTDSSGGALRTYEHC